MALYHRIKRQILSQTGIVRVVLLVVGIVALLGAWKFLVQPIAHKVSDLRQAYNQELPAYQDRINFLLLGVAGGDHDGPELTDTIIFVSIRPSDSDVALLSIPRDIWVSSMRAKINTAFYYGEKKQPNGGGFTLAKAAVSEVVGVPAQYVAMINFVNFEKVIDALGGIDITVDETFDDHKFPIPGKELDECGGDPEYACRYEQLHFEAGAQHMDGKTALKYVRSRQSQGDEGTDFARSKRQEKLLLAVKEKLTSTGVITSPTKLRNLYESVVEAVTTDVDASLYPAMAKLAAQLAKNNTVRTATLSAPDQLYNPPLSATYDRQWVLLPRPEDPNSIQNFTKDLLQLH